MFCLVAFFAFGQAKSQVGDNPKEPAEAEPPAKEPTTTQPAKPKGPNLLAAAKWTFSVDGGKTFAPAVQIAANQSLQIVAHAEFEVADPAALGGLEVVIPKGGPDITINGKAPEGLLPRMIYSTYSLDPTKVLIKGKNVVLATKTLNNKTSAPVNADMPAVLTMIEPQNVGVQTGPILGCAGEGFFTLTCRTNMPAAVSVSAKPEPAGEEVIAASPRGYYHRMKIVLPKDTKAFTYTVTTQSGLARNTTEPVKVKVPGAAKPFRFAAVGDCRSNPTAWKTISDALTAVEPELVLFSGDLVGAGRVDFTWDREFAGPAKTMLSRIPFYTVAGNHEQSAAAFFTLFYAPNETGRPDNWAQAAGGVLFIGIDGGKPNDEMTKFVETALAASKEKFIFLMTHYPAYSSGMHGKRPDGGMGYSKKVLMPLLAKYNATAMIAGHDHDYERSEPPAGQGVTCIVAGGGGAPLYGRQGRNSYSKVFLTKLHYCIFEVKGDTCEMKAYDAQGKVLDETVFKARN
ncbi:MAG: metallophosphoesterase [Planctomycetaceae bacterium]|nr:metallophosphoesterase [Planctomycetaceae bacterium]